MAGVIFIVNVPRREYEKELQRKEKSATIVIEKEKYEKASKIIHELKENKRFGTIKCSMESCSQEDNTSVISKCKSTDCLHTNDKPMGLYKCRSENTLEENDKLSLESERKSYFKSSWEEVKQVIKTKKNKLRITQPGCGVDMLAAFHWDTPLEIILAEVIARLEIKNASWNVTRDDKFWQVIFSMESSNLCEELLQVLRTFGIGSRQHSSVSVIPCTLYYKSNYTDSNQQLTEKEKPGSQSDTNSAWSRFSSSVRARTNLAQVLHDVRAEAALTFDWLFLLIVAAFVAAIGLVENSTVILVASMLISPLMAPITAGTLGTAVHDRSLQRMGVMHEMLGLFLSLVIGFTFGLAICAVDERYGVGEWPTYEMTSRCEIRSLWVGVLVAIPSGAGVALAVLGEYTASLVGVAISASLLPPAVNAGLLWAMALVHLMFMNDDTRWTGVVTTPYYSSNQPIELAVLGTVSLCLTLVNIVCIFLAGVAVYKVKEVCPLERRDISWWRKNKNALQSSKRSHKKESATVVWDIYSKWCNESLEDEHESGKKNATLGLIQSDTVTFRHPPSQRLKAQNIESYCLHKAQINENYVPLCLQSEDSENQSDVNQENVSKGSSNNSEINCEKKKSLNYDSLYNIGHQDLNGTANKSFEQNSEETQYPIIEPSLNFTVDSKKCGLILGSKSFDV